MKTIVLFCLVGVVLLHLAGCGKPQRVDYTLRVNQGTKPITTISLPEIGPFEPNDDFGGPPVDWKAPFFKSDTAVKVKQKFRVEVEVSVSQPPLVSGVLLELTDREHATADDYCQVSSDVGKIHDLDNHKVKILFLLNAPDSPGTYYIHLRGIPSWRLIGSASVLVKE